MIKTTKKRMNGSSSFLLPPLALMLARVCNACRISIFPYTATNPSAGARLQRVPYFEYFNDVITTCYYKEK
jgi:hypothetical protein